MHRTFFAALLLLSGCATLDSVHPGEGTKINVTGKGYEEVWKASLAAASKNMTIQNSFPEVGVIKASTEVSAFSYGEVVGIYITPAKPNQPSYSIEIISKKRLATNVTAKDWEPIIADAIKAELQ